MIPFNVPAIIGDELENIQAIFKANKFSGDGSFSKNCQELLTSYLNTKKTLLTTSCTDALEMAAILLDIQQGDEVIMPSFTFVSTANAFALRGATIVFLDVNPTTMNIDETLIESAINAKTKAIVLVHYAGWSCDIETVQKISKKYNIPIVEDAAQAIGSTYKGKKLGTIGDISCFSFHETKNIHCGEGGAIVLNNEKYIQRAEIIREKGTNRSQFLRGQTDKYTWVDIGSSFLPSELNAAFLYSQIQKVDQINDNRLRAWERYFIAFKDKIEILECPKTCSGNAHLFSIKCSDIEERSRFIDHLKRENISSVFHYVPLHSSLAGKKYGYLSGSDTFTTKESERLVRLPLYYNLSKADQDKVIESTLTFFKK